MIGIKNSDLYIGHPNAWSDWALHIGIANIFNYKNPSDWFSYHPIYAQGKFTYPFLSDFISGIFERIGFSLSLSFIAPSILTSLFLIVGIYLFFLIITNSKKASLLGISFFMLSSGLGFVNFIKDFLSNPSIDLLLYPLAKYSNFATYDWYTGNVIVGLLIPQRGFLLGMTVGIWALIGLIYSLKQTTNKNFTIISGALAGLLPIIHPHSFIAVVLLSGSICLINSRQWKTWIFYFIPAFMVSITLFTVFIWGGVENKTFFQILPGWTSTGGILGWAKMWMTLWGAMIPLSIFGVYILYKLKRDKKILSIAFGFYLIFIISNFFLFQPVRWDNTKLFWWSYLGFSIFSSYVLIIFSKRGLLLKIFSVLIGISLIFTGILELLNFIQFDKHTYRLSSRDEINLGQEIRQKTKPNEIFLTAPKHNHLVSLWGVRPILIGYTAWVWNFGFNHSQTEQDTYQMFKGGNESQVLLKKYKISYIFIGPAEINEFHANKNYFQSNFPLILSDKENKIYDVRNLLK